LIYFGLRRKDESSSFRVTSRRNCSNPRKVIQRMRFQRVGLFYACSTEALLIGIAGFVFLSRIGPSHFKTNSSISFVVGILLAVFTLLADFLVLRRSRLSSNKQRLIFTIFTCLPILLLDAILIVASLIAGMGFHSSWKIPVLVLLIFQWIALFSWEMFAFTKSIDEGAWTDSAPSISNSGK